MRCLETRETARGLIMEMPDVLFDFNKYTLKPAAREKLAKVSGILLAHPDLKVQVEGHTDSVGSEEYNQKLSEAARGKREGLSCQPKRARQQRDCGGIWEERSDCGQLDVRGSSEEPTRGPGGFRRVDRSAGAAACTRVASRRT